MGLAARRARSPAALSCHAGPLEEPQLGAGTAKLSVFKPTLTVRTQSMARCETVTHNRKCTFGLPLVPGTELLKSSGHPMMGVMDDAASCYVDEVAWQHLRWGLVSREPGM